MPEIRVAASAGFCFGVKRAVEKAFSLAKEGKLAVTFGPIIHNPQVIEQLASMGIVRKRIPPGSLPGKRC